MNVEHNVVPSRSSLGPILKICPMTFGAPQTENCKFDIPTGLCARSEGVG